MTAQKDREHESGHAASDSVLNVGFVMDEVFLEHNTGGHHPESRARLESVHSFLMTYEHRDHLLSIPPRMATAEEILLVHTPRLFKQIERTRGEPLAHIDPDTVVSSRSYEVGRLAVGAILASIDQIMEGTCARAFAFVRPPGHHAEPDRAMGFCLFNNVALGAAYAIRRYGLGRILIVDFDVHHGNGTQAAFYETSQVLYVSTHQFPFYPGTGARQEMGQGKGVGYTLNFPLPAGTGDEVYQRIFQEILEPVAEQYRPELVLVSAGFDSYFADPLANMRVTPAGFRAMTRSLLNIADQHSGGKILFVLEGGYNLQGLRDSTRAVMDELLGLTVGTARLSSPSEHSAHLMQLAKGPVTSFWKL